MKVEQGVGLTEETLEALSSIRDVVVELGAEINQISSEDRQVAEAISQTEAAINQLDTNTQRNAQIADRTADATVSLSELMQSVAAMTDRFRVSSKPASGRAPLRGAAA